MKSPGAPSLGDRKQTDVYLRPGEFFVGDASCRVRTLLGSCVSVTLWDPVKRVGAMSHFLLATRQGGTPPTEPDTAREKPLPLDGRYGDEALHLMLAELADQRVGSGQCEAKIFGGGDMFPPRDSAGPLTVGRRNGEAARELLLNRGIEVISESLFGDGHRQIVFDIATGHVWSRQAKPSAIDAMDTTPRPNL
jgi:chemotaxis protein CheD